MDDEITYAVYWRTTYNPRKFTRFVGWFTDYDTARELADTAAENSDCIEAKVVERVETYSEVCSIRGRNNVY